jgi:hypothetical protein
VGGNLRAVARRQPDAVHILFHIAGAFAEAAIAALAALEVRDCFQQMNAAEVGPEAVGDQQLRVGDLPQQII